MGVVLHALLLLQHVGPRGPLAADSPIVTGELPCWLCFRRFQAADTVTLCMMEPVDPATVENLRGVKTVEGKPTHWACLMQFLRKASPAAAGVQVSKADVDRN